MNWQQATTLGIVAVTAAVMLGRRWRKRQGGCGGLACHCSGTSHESSPPRVVLQARKGERSRIVVKAN